MREDKLGYGRVCVKGIDVVVVVDIFVFMDGDGVDDLVDLFFIISLIVSG